MLIDKLVLLIMAAIVFVPTVGGMIYYAIKGDKKMDIYTQCFDCKHFGKDCMDMIGTEPACDCYEPRESEGGKDDRK